VHESKLNFQQTRLQALREVEDTRSDLVSTIETTHRLTDALGASDQSLKSAN